MAEGGVDKIDFTLYDEDFNVYVAKVTPAEAAVLRIGEFKFVSPCDLTY